MYNDTLILTIAIELFSQSRVQTALYIGPW